MIKKLFLSLLLLVSCSFATEPMFTANYATAVTIAQKENKNILLMLSQPGCGACIYMKNTVLKNEDVVNALRNYVVFEANIYKDEWNKKYRAFGTPTIYFLDKNENKLKHAIGALEPSEMLKVIKLIESGKK